MIRYRRELRRHGLRDARVERFTDSEVLGWVDVAPDAPPQRVALFVDDVEAAATWAVDAVTSDSATERRVFRLALRDVWQFCAGSTRLTVRIDGVPVHIAGWGRDRPAPRAGRRSPAALGQRLDAGHVFGQFGRLQLSKTRDVAWQRRVMSLYERVHRVVADEFGYETFFCYGTLLGAVREQGFIGHDLDFDAAYISRFSDGASAARELRDVALQLVDAGLDVVCKRTALHVYDDVAANARVDLFHLYFDDAGRLAFPFGVAGRTVVAKDAWLGVEAVPFAGSTGHLPRAAEALAEHIYGPNWRVPKPGFQWERDRTARAPRESIMPVDFGIEVFWEKFYARQAFAEASPFAIALGARRDLASTVVDLGCGDGRDATHFAQRGCRVVGIDRSRAGLTHARARAAGTPTVFYRRDLRRPGALAGLDLPSGPALFYARFLLHAVEDATQRVVLAGVRAAARIGDELALEVRTEPGSWRYGKHYRRPVDGAQLLSQLTGSGWTIVNAECGPGLALHGGEDPHVLRLLARRTG